MSESAESHDKSYEPSVLKSSIEALKNGNIILYPTDTIWGLGCDPFDEQAVKRLRSIKDRAEDKPFILLVDSQKRLKDYINKIHPRVETLLHHHQRPLTIVYHSVRNIPDYLKADDGSVAIRIVMDDFCKDMIAEFDKPVISTSANVSGETPPAHFGEVSSEIIQQVDHVVKYRQDEQQEAVPSTIATYDEEGELQFLRE